MSLEEKPTAAFVLSLIGGILGLVLTLYFLFVLFDLVSYRFGDGLIFDYLPFIMVCWGGPCAALVIIGAVMMYKRPEKSTTWGIIVLVFSLIGMSTILGIIGGVLAIAWKPRYAPPSYPSPPSLITRICPQCGRVLKEDMKFCPYCGKAFES